jgi:CheY-like chemotaxis protein
MPGISGYEVAKRIKENPAMKNIPVVAFTASVFNSEKIGSCKHFDDFLFKPIRRAELFKVLRKYLKYEVEDELELSEKSVNQETFVVNPEVLPRLPEIQQILESKFLPEWEGIKDSLVLFKIRSFSEALAQFAQEYNFHYLYDYAKRITDDVEMIELESLKFHLGEFRIILGRIGDLINSQGS